MVLNKPDDYKRSPDSQMHDDKTAGLVADHDGRSKDVFAQLADMDVEWLPMSLGQGQTGYAIGQGCYAISQEACRY
ncbi:predicted protein [Lichtheimia corymbifera JMRC:FSU:9682]|uniref:Uncharacterized protein n=1 Tax=Lichtheimia corymbifera JMRC:FSU:9682 TaxID=1263082 RepID=A0A068S4E2_9FUNG|nr:predicted protein [Lichtheimia corymbifera JMRC:FSU:9682]